MDQRLDGYDMSLDAPIKEDSETEKIAFLSSESTTAEEQVAQKEIDDILHLKITEFKKLLNDRELEIFDTRIFSESPVTLQEIGEKYDISRERVRQVEKKIIKRMKEFFHNEIPDFDTFKNNEV